MTFQSLKFILFFLCAVLAVFLVPRKIQNIVLLLCNLIFVFFAGGLRTLCFILIATLSTFFAACAIGKAESQRMRKVWLLLVLLLNVAFLFVLKYSAFFTSTANAFSRIFHLGVHFEFLKITAPIGISFYTLWMLGYLLDVYWKSYEPQKNFIDYAVSATYFPLIISGPIVRYQNMREEFAKPRVLTTENVSKGILRVCWGYFEKMVIADNIARLVNQIYGSYTEFSGFYILFGTACFAIQLYTDFAGCIDIALGCSKILGIKLPENFDAPFFSKSISEYWRRWHITLGTWFKDYLMYPLLKSNAFVTLGQKIKKRFGKKAGKKIPVYLAMAILWFSVGFWHGGVWKYIIGSGLLHCFYMICSDMLDGLFKKVKSLLHINDDAWWWKLFQMIRTFLLVCSGFVFFRAGGIRHALSLYRHLLCPAKIPFAEFLLQTKMQSSDFLALVIFVFSVCLVSAFRKLNGPLAVRIYENKILSFLSSIFLVALVFVFASTAGTSFIYFQF